MPDLVVAADPDALAERVADDLVTTLRSVLATQEEASLVLTGGGIARAVHRHVAGHPDLMRVDWARVEVWWGDERFVAAQDAERNAAQAREDLLDRLPLDPSRVHEVAADDGTGDLGRAAAAYQEQLAAWGRQRGGRSWFDVLLLGIGPDGHCASLFPGRPEVHADGLVVAVADSPKPPPDRVSMTLPTLQRADQVWFVAAGAEKADAVGRSVAGGAVAATPAAGPRGRRTTRWYLDPPAAPPGG